MNVCTMASRSMKSFRNLLRELRVPVIQAPMVGGLNNPELAAAVMRSGGIASFGFAYSDADKIRMNLQATRKNCATGYLNANFFIFAEPEQPLTDANFESAKKALRELSKHGDVKLENPKQPYFFSLDSQLEPIWEDKESKVDILSFHFGLPPSHVVEKAKKLGKYIGVTATCVDEAKQIVEMGADYIVVQGVEAGGHRGVFTSTMRNRVKASTHDEFLRTDDLLGSLLMYVNTLPAENRPALVASGGIMTPQDIVKHVGRSSTRDKDPMLADAVQLGTAFLTMKESSTPQSFKAALLAKDAHRKVVLTKAFSGRIASAMRNTFTEKMEGKYVLPHPVQNTLTGSIRQHAQRDGDIEYQSMFCGQNYDQCVETSVKEYMDSIYNEYNK
jgi:nitronate monooxygenase